MQASMLGLQAWRTVQSLRSLEQSRPWCCFEAVRQVVFPAGRMSTASFKHWGTKAFDG